MRTRQRFRLGDRVVVEATNVSLQRRQIDFALVRRLTPPRRSAGEEREEEENYPRITRILIGIRAIRG